MNRWSKRILDVLLLLLIASMLAQMVYPSWTWCWLQLACMTILMVTAYTVSRTSHPDDH